MKRALLVLCVVMITAFSYSLLSFADYIIHLKSGRQFVTQRYWEEGGEIKFHFKSGVLGVPKEAVVSIEEVVGETPAKDEAPPEAAPAEEKKEGKEVREPVKKTEKEEAKKKEKKVEDTKPIHEYWAQKKALKVELDEALERLREATNRKDAAGKKEAREDMRKLSKEIYKLTDKVKEMNNGKLPDYWWQD